MPEQNYSYSNADPGRASYEVLDTYTQGFLLSHAEPGLQPAQTFLAAGQDAFAQFSVVGFDGDGLIAMATQDGTVQAAFVLAHGIDFNGSSNRPAHCWYVGCFNPNALVWDASFTTREHKLAAFNEAKNPTNILIRYRTSAEHIAAGT